MTLTRPRARSLALAPAPALALVAALLTSACGGGGTFVPVSLLVDGDTCATSAPDQVRVACDQASVGVWLRDQNSTILEDACVDFPGTGKTLSDLPPLLADQVDLSGLAAGAVYLEIAVRSPGSAAQGCPTLDVTDDPDLIVWGDSPVADLGGTSGLFVTLYCTEPYGASGACYSACDDDYNLCFDQGIQAACTSARDRCEAACTDQGCTDACEAQYGTCVSGGDDGTCQSDLDTCLAGCADSTCQAQCQSDYADCLEQAACDAMYDGCATACDSAPATCPAG